jgi:pSer/pThr/pTyr-binding forkhead associated (FHA) protein
VLIVLEGKQQNLRITLNQEEMVLGRDMSSDIIVEDGLASRRHARLVYANIDRDQEIPDCRLFDEKSTNGTFVNEERVEPDGAWLSDRDRIRIGRTVFGFFIRDEEEIRLDLKLAPRGT